MKGFLLVEPSELDDAELRALGRPRRRPRVRRCRLSRRAARSAASATSSPCTPGTAAIAPARVERQRRARVVADHRAGRARDRVAGDDVVRVVVREHHALDLRRPRARPTAPTAAPDAAEAQRAAVDLAAEREVGVHPRPAAVERVAHARRSPRRSAPTSTTDAAVDPHAEERQVDHAQHRHAVLEQPEHHAAQRRAGGVVDRAVERVGDPHAPAMQIARRRPPRRRTRSPASRPRARPSSPPRTPGRPRSGSPWPPCRSASAARSRPARSTATAVVDRGVRGVAARGSHRQRTRHRAQHGGLGAGVVERAQRHAVEPDQVAAGEAPAACRRRPAARSRPRSTTTIASSHSDST